MSVSPASPKKPSSLPSVLQPIGSYCWQEARVVASVVREPGLWALLGIALLLWSLVYQAAFGTVLQIGGDRVSHRREDDAPFLRGFNGSEPAQSGMEWWTLSPGYAYRWTKSDARVELPGVGGGRWIVALTASSGRADGSPTTSHLSFGQRRYDLPIAPERRSYYLLADSDAKGDLQLRFETPRYVPEGTDPRELGFVVNRIELNPELTSMRTPAWGQFGWLAAIVALGYLLLRRNELPKHTSFWLGLALVGLIGLLLHYQRLPLTIFTPIVFKVLLSAYALALLLIGFARPFVADPWQIATSKATIPLLASPILLIALAFGLRLAGVWHPHTLINDIGLHANNILELSLGKVYFTEHLPSESGGGPSPYPPGSYLLLLPFQVLFQPSMANRIALINIGMALLDSMVVGAIWLMLWRAGLGLRTAMFGAALYLLPPPMLSSFSIGEAANIGGQALAIPLIALLSFAKPENSWRHAWFLLLPVMCLAILGHMGVTFSVVCLLAAVWLLVAINPLWRASLLRLTAVGLVAAAFVALVYYSVPLFVAIFTNRAMGVTEIPVDTSSTSAWQRMWWRISSLFTPGNRIIPVLTVAGLAGLFLLRERLSSNAFPLVARSWWLGVLFSLVLLLIAQQGVREQHFLFPALCLTAAPLLRAFWQRGRAGRWAAWLGLLVPIAFGLGFWVRQLINYLH
jgi:hypothetical protein